MSSYEDRLKERKNKYKDPGTSVGKQESKQESKVTPADTSKYDERISQRKGKYSDPRVEIDDSYIDSFLKDARKYANEGGGLNAKLGVDTSSSIYKNRKETAEDLRSRSGAISRYLEQNRDSIPDEYYTTLKDYLDNFDKYTSQSLYSTYKADKFYSQFDSPEAYEKWLQYSTPENRQAQYERNKARLDELKQQRRASVSYQPASSAYLTGEIPYYGSPLSAAHQGEQITSLTSDIDREIAQIEKEMRMYERGETDEAGNYYGSKVADDYGKYLQDTKFLKASQNRAFQNGDRAALSAYDAEQSQGSMALSNGGYIDEDGNIRDAYGNVAQDTFEAPVQDKLGLFLSASDEDIGEAYTILGAVQGSYPTTWANILQEGDTKRWKYLEEDELSIYYGLLNTEGQDAAYRYLDAMEVELGRREMQQTKAYIDETSGLEQIMLNVASVPLNMIGGIAATVDNATRLIEGKGLNPYSRANALLSTGNYIRSNTAQEIDAATGNKEIPGLGFSFGDAYQAGMSMVDSLVGAKIGGKAYQAVMSMGAASSEMARLYSQGASTEQMILSGVAAGAAEWVFEKYSIENLISMKSPETLGQFLKNAFIQGGIEMSEEAATEFANILTNGLIMQSESDWAKALEANGGNYGKAIGEMAIQIANAGLGGFLSGMGSGSIQQGMQYGAQQQENKKIGSYISGANSTDALVALAQEMAGGASGKAQKKLTAQSERLGKDFRTEGGKNKATGRLYNTVQSVVTEQNIGEISSALQEKGFSKKDATAIAGALAVQTNGIALTEKQEKVLEKFGDNADVKSVVSEILGNEDSGINQRSRSLARFEFGAMRNHIVSQMEQSAAVQKNGQQVDNVDTLDEKGAESRYEVSAEGMTVDKSTGEIVNVKEVASTSDGKLTLRLEDGRTVNAEDVSFGSAGEALVYETVAQMGASVKAANILVNQFKATEGMDAESFAQGISEAFRYGKIGVELSKIPQDSFARKLNAGQLEFAHRQGKRAAGKQVAREQATVRKNRTVAENATTQNDRNYQATLAEGIKEKSLTESQKASYRLADQIAAAAKVNIRVYDGKTGEHGYYDPKTDEIYLNLNATNKSRKSMMAFTLGHELVHRAKAGSPAKYKQFANFLVEQYGKQGSDIEAMIGEELAAAKRFHIEMSYEEAFEEVICDACERMLLDTDAGKKLAEFGAQSKQNKSFLDDLKRWITEFMDKLRSIFAGVEPNSIAAQEFAKFDESVKKILADMYVDMTIDAGEHLSTIQNAFGKGTVVETNEQGEFTMANSQDGAKKVFNLVTWENGGRETMEATLLREGYTAEEVKAALTIMDGKHQLVKDLEKQFPEQNRINQATITTDLKDGHSVLSALVSNGDYPVNIDLLMVCKKRKAYQRVINRLCETGMIQQATVDALAIAEINKILGKYGFETACLGCFVESRRLRIQEWAQTICKEWNTEVKKRNPNAKAFGFGKGEAKLTPDEVMKLIGELESGGDKNDKGNLNLGQGSAVKRMGVLLDKVPSLRKTLSIEDLITPDGLSSLRRFDSNLFSMVKSRYGSNSPKFVQEFNPYNHELAKYGKVPSEYKSLREYLYAIGGARMQSFSDFIVENWFDYCQIVADLAARKLPMHTYTKEIALAKLLGMTGIKINMSLIPDIDRSLGKDLAGLTRNEKGELELIWADKDRFKKTGGKSYMQSINFADAMALQEDPRYSANVGTIAIGVSDKQIIMMLDDARIRMVIPYHSSGMNPIFADLMGTSFYKDYTMVQNTTVKQVYNSKGQKVTLKLDKTQTGKLTSGFQFNEVLQELGDARAAAQAYKDWCADASKHTITIKDETYTAELTPKFDDFSWHENYYKLLEDFNTYDCISEQAAPQGDVQQIYPEDFNKILEAELKAQEGHRQKQAANQAFDKAMAEIEDYLKNHTKADTVFYAEQHGVKLSAKDKKLGAEDKKKLAELRKGVKHSLPKVHADAVEKFGTTTAFEEAGFILPSGEMLKFTDDKHRGERYYDHRVIGMVYGVNIDPNVHHGFNEESNKHLEDFVEKGGIRFDPGSPDLDMDAGMQLSRNVPITAAQEQTIREFIAWKKQREETYNPDDDPFSLYSGPLALHIDFGGNANTALFAKAKDLDAWGIKHLSYEGGQINADRIIADIRHYYRTGETRKPSLVAQFRYSLPKMGDKKSPTTLTEQDLRDLLQKAKDGEMADGTYFPVRINTPDALLDAIRTVAKKKGITDKAELDKLTADRPIAIQVFKARQSLATEEDWDENGRPHNLSIDDFVGMVKKMDEPEYIVYEGSTGRYVEVLKYKTANGKDTFAVVELENFKGEQHLNGYGQDTYNILVTMYQPDAKKRVTKLLNGEDNIVIHPKQKKGNSQLTSGIHVPSVLNKLPFAPTVPQEIDGVKTDPDVDRKLPVGEDTSPRALLANAFESVAQNDIERNKIQEYKGKIDLINAEERKLSELKEQIKELSFAKGPKDTKKIRELQFEANQAANRISVYDKQLLRLEASAPLQNVLTREKDMARKRAEQKGKEALAAYREKSAKTQRALMDRYEQSRKRAVENREKTAMRHKIQNVVGELNNLLLHGDKKRHVPENLKKAVADALALVNMDTVGAEERAAKYAALIAKETDPDKIDAYTVTMENILRQGEKMGQRLKELRDAYEEFQESDDPDIANAYDPVIAGCLKELAGSIGNTSLRNMSIEQLSDVYDMYRMVLTRVRDANKTLLENIKENISNLASRVIGEVRMTGGEHKYRAAVLDPARKFLWNNMKPVYAMEWIGSSTLTKVFNNVRAGEDTWAKDVTEAREYYLDKSRKYGYDSWDFEKKYRFTSASETEFELTLEQILSLYAYSKRKQADDHLRLGGFVFDSNIETYTEDGSKLLKYKVNTADAHQITTEILAQIIGTLSSEQMEFVDEMQDYLSTVMGAKGNEVTMKMYGVKLFREKHYFPLKSAKQFMFEQNEVSGEVKIKNSGFTNKVVAKANNPVILSNFMDVWAGHVNDMSMYHSFVLPLEDFNRVFNYNSPKKDNEPSVSVKGTIQNAYSPAAVNYVKNMITDLNGGARTDSTTGVINKMMGLFKKGAVFASASVVVQQPSAIARAAALVDTKYFIGPKVDHKRHKELWDEVKQYAPVAIIKEMGYFDTNMGKSTQDFILGKEYSGIKEKMKAIVTDGDYRDEVLSKAPALADEIAWCGIWDAVKREMHDKHPGLDVKGEPFLMLAGSRFTEVITKTQVYDSVLSRSANMRSKDTGMKMATAFMAEPTTSINMIADALLQGKRGGKEGRRYCRKTVGAVIASVVLNSFLVAWVQAARDDDEDESYMEKYVGSFTAEMLDGMNPLTYIPFIKDIVSIVQGYDVERSDMSVISDVVNAIRKLASDKVSGWKKVEDFAGSVCQIFGLPVKNIMRDVRGAWQAFDTIVNGEKTTARGIGYAVKGAITGKEVSNPNQLYEARLAQDAAHTARVEARYEDEDSANAAVRQAIKNDFMDGKLDSATAMDRMVEYTGMTSEEAYWLMDAWKYRKSMGTDDGYSKYSAFFEAVKTGKNLKVVIKNYINNGITDETLASQITKEFKDKYVEMSAGERAAIKGYLINAFEQCGIIRMDAEEKLADWDFEAKHGFDYANRGEAYRNREITREQLMDAMQTYGGMTEEEAERYIAEQDFQVATGYAYKDRVKAYKEGYLDADTMHMALMNISGLTDEEANLQIEAYDWEAQGIAEDVTWQAVRDYYEYCAAVNVPQDAYLYIRSFSNNTENDVDEATGKTIYYSAMKRVMAEINGLPGLTAEQKTAIAKSLGWSDKNIRKYKLW